MPSVHNPEAGGRIHLESAPSLGDLPLTPELTGHDLEEPREAQRIRRASDDRALAAPPKSDEWRLSQCTPSEYIRGLLTGDPPNGTPPEAFGDYQDLLEVLHHAHAAGGTAAVRTAWAGIVTRQPQLAALVSGDPPAGPTHDLGADACPDVLWRGRFADVAEALGKRSWEVWAGTFAALAAVAHRQVHLRYHGPLYGMAYVLLVKPTGLGKSECTHTCRALLPADYVIRDAVQSGPGLAPILAEIDRDKYGRARQVWPRPAILLIEEWTALLKNMGIQNSTLMDALNALFQRASAWNVSRSDRPGAGGDLVIPEPALSICATTTTSLLTQHVGEGLIRSGFLNRYLVLPGSGAPWRFYLPDAAGLDYDALAGRLDDLCNRRWVGGNLWEAYTPEARARMVTWGEETLEPIMQSEAVEDEALKRLHVYAHLVALLYAWSEHEPRIERPHVEAAIAVITVACDFVRHLMRTPADVEPPAYTRYQIALEHKVLARLRATPGIPRRAVVMALAGRSAKSADINTLIDQLIKTGQVREVPMPGAGRKRTRVLYAETPPA
jgi:Protein of unknown function (DUF3987)